MNLQTIIKKIDSYERLMRIDKPIGILLLLWPTLWALLIAGHGKPYWIIVLIFVAGTVLMRSAGCVMNDIADSKYDGLVERTQHRPLVNNEVSKKEAYILAAALSLVAFGLVCTLNALTIKLSFLALILAASYPFTKRFLRFHKLIWASLLALEFPWLLPLFWAMFHQWRGFYY